MSLIERLHDCVLDGVCDAQPERKRLLLRLTHSLGDGIGVSGVFSVCYGHTGHGVCDAPCESIGLRVCHIHAQRLRVGLCNGVANA